MDDRYGRVVVVVVVGAVVVVVAAVVDVVEEATVVVPDVVDVVRDALGWLAVKGTWACPVQLAVTAKAATAASQNRIPGAPNERKF